MRIWLKLALEEVRAEFPSNEVAQAFRCFNVHEKPQHRSREAMNESLGCLAKACDVDTIELQAEFYACDDMAIVEARATGCDAKSAWATVLRGMQARRAEVRAKHRTDAIRQVVARWFAFCASTSGVEQGFTASQVAVTDRQNANPPLERAYIKLKVDSGRDDEGDLCKLAQTEWALSFGMPRRHLKSRMDKGVKRSFAATCTEAEFLRNRRRTVGPEEDLATTTQSIDSLQVEGWTEDHAKEAAFARKKLHDRLVQATDEGVLVDASPELEAEARSRNDKMLKQSLARHKLAAKVRAQSRGGTLPTRGDLQGKAANVQRPADAVHLISWGLRRKLALWEVDVFIVDTPCSTLPKNRILWAAVLLGGWMINRDVLMNRPAATCLKYKKALTLKRRLYITESFAQRHGGVAAVIRGCIQHAAGSNWTVLPDLMSFEAVRGQSGTVALKTYMDDIEACTCMQVSTSLLSQCTRTTSQDLSRNSIGTRFLWYERARAERWGGASRDLNQKGYRWATCNVHSQMRCELMLVLHACTYTHA
jgi:hypothetical protein